MTVADDAAADKKYECEWFDKEGKRQTGRFAEATLTFVKRAPGGGLAAKAG
jgi:uncharacterized protein YodC (DUF2158 family)